MSKKSELYKYETVPIFLVTVKIILIKQISYITLSEVWQVDSINKKNDMSGNCSVPSIPLFLMQVILNISIEQCNFISKYVESGRNVVTYNYPQIVLSSIQLFMFSSSLHTNDHYL